ncbi:MAG: DMT family transporter [Pseudomonadota bacterium]
MQKADAAGNAHTDQGFGQAILLVLLANFLFSLVDTSTKWLAIAGLTAFQLAFMRYAMHFAITLGESVARGAHYVPFAPEVRNIILVRAIALVSATLVNFIALEELPLSVTASIMFLSPVLVCLFARVLLNEPLTARRLAAVALGLVGVTIIINPFGAELNWYAVMMLYPASGLAFYLVLTRMLADKVSPLAMQSSMGMVGTIALAPFALFAWNTPSSSTEWVLLFSIGAFAWAGHEVLTRAHAMREASALAPFSYSLVLYLIFFGWLIFDSIPTLNTIIGALCVVTAGFIAFGGRRSAVVA